MAKKPNKEMRRRYAEAIEYGCILCRNIYGVKTEATIHHLTGAGMGLRDLENFIPLCPRHHLYEEGIHFLGRRVWEEKFGTQLELLEMYKNDTNNGGSTE